MSGRNVHLVGSVPLDSVREVFETVTTTLNRRLRRLPDGEVGERTDWIIWLETLFSENPAFERSDEIFQVHEDAATVSRYKLRPGVSLEAVRFPNLFYADIAIQSYSIFRELKDEGRLDENLRFQVALVPAHSVIWLFVVEELHSAIDPIYNAALKREIDKIAASIPHRELAIQFDVASAVFARLERGTPNNYGRTKDEMQASFSNIMIELGNHVPADIELLFHLCYGDANHRHAVEPTDMGDMVEFTNQISKGMRRKIDLVHMPVPRNRFDDAYFRPLRRLELQSATELCLGLVHATDGVEGTLRRAQIAKRFVRDFSIATECGFGRRPKWSIPELLRIHAEVADAV